MTQALFPRVIDRMLEGELLSEFPAVFVVGPRGCGKSTSMGQFADTILDLSTPGVHDGVSLSGEVSLSDRSSGLTAELRLAQGFAD